MREITSLSDADRVNSVIYFTAPWCGPCRILGPLVEDLAKTYHGLNFIKVNIDEAQDMAIEYRVQSVPTLLLLVNSEEKHRFVGLQAKTAFEKVFNEYVGELD